MTSPIDPATIPLLPTKDTGIRLRHFSPTVYNVSEKSALYSYVDAMVGDAGVGTLKKDVLISRLTQSIDTTHFSDLDNTFGNLLRLTRLASETYQQNPATDLLTSEELAEIHVKDAWYRARIRNFFTALGLGGTPDGLRLMIKAALGVDCEIYEMWRFQDHYGEIYGIADVESVKNLILNPSFEYDVGSWSITTGGTGAALTRNTALSSAIKNGSACLQFNTGTTVTNPKISGAAFAASPAKNYTFSLYYFRPTATALTTAALAVDSYDATGALLSSQGSGSFATTADTLVRAQYNFTTPANTATVIPRFSLVGSITTPAVNVYIDSVMVQAVTVPQPYFDGDQTGYRWTGVIGASASIKASPIDALSRTKVPSRNEVVLYPHKSTLSTLEMIEARNMTKRIAPVDSVITITNTGYAVNVPVGILMAKADTTFFLVNSYITGAPGSALTPEEEPNPSFRWLKNGVEVKAPAMAFNQPQESSQYYLYSKDSRSSIDSVAYTSQAPNGTIKKEPNYTSIVEAPNTWGPWITFEKADSPDNYPGGMHGHAPTIPPPVSHRAPYVPYIFPYKSQKDYVAKMAKVIAKAGGQLKGTTQYRLPIAGALSAQNTWTPDEAVANVEPMRASTVTTGWFLRPGNGKGIS